MNQQPVGVRLTGKALHGIGWSALDKWANRAIHFVVFVALARLLDPLAFGVVALANVYLSLCRVFSEQGFSAALIQREALTREHLDTAFWTTLAVALPLVTLSWFVSSPVASLYGEPLLGAVIIWLSLNLVFAALNSVQIALLQRDFKFAILAKRSLLASVGGGAVGVTMAYGGYGVWSLVGMSLISSLVGVLVLWSSTTWRPAFRFSFRCYRELFSFGANVVGTNLVKFVGRHLDKIVIGLFLTTEAVGIYKIAHNLVHEITSGLSGLYSRVALPFFARLQNNREKLREAFSMMTKMSLLTAAPLFAVLGIYADQLIPWMFGQQWLESVAIVRILTLLGLLYTVTYFNEPMLYALGRPGWQLSLAAVRTLTKLVLILLAVPFGLHAVAAAVVLAAYLNWPITMRVISRHSGLPMRDYGLSFARSLVPTACMSLILVTFAAMTPVVHAGAGTIVAAFVAAALLHVGLLWHREAAFLRTSFRLVQKNLLVRRA